MLSSAPSFIFLPVLRAYLHWTKNTAQFTKNLLKIFIKKLASPLATDLIFVFQMNLIANILHNFWFLKNLYGVNIHFGAAVLTNKD